MRWRGEGVHTQQKLRLNEERTHSDEPHGSGLLKARNNKHTSICLMYWVRAGMLFDDCRSDNVAKYNIIQPSLDDEETQNGTLKIQIKRRNEIVPRRLRELAMAERQESTQIARSECNENMAEQGASNVIHLSEDCSQESRRIHRAFW